MNTVVIGAQWGDEGKAKIVDILSEKADIVVRYQGGANAGHTVVHNDQKYILHLIPTGILHPDTICLIGNGVVVDLEALLQEIADLEALGIDTKGRIKISNNAHVLLPFHKMIDANFEESTDSTTIGTTKRGIGPCYTDKYNRVGVRISDLFWPEVFKKRLSENLATKNLIVSHLLKQEKIDINQVINQVESILPRIEPMVVNGVNYLHQQIAAGRKILFEGAQGTLLDVDFGTYPFLTSSNPTIGGVFTGTGINPAQITDIIGITKAYQTRVGTGPFPTELIGEPGEQLRRVGHEFGATTGRPRRCGWLDLVALKYAVMVNGFTQLALTKIDILDQYDEINLGIGYIYNGNELSEYPIDTHILGQCRVKYETLPGWGQSLTGLTNYADFPENAQKYIQYIEDFTRCRVGMVSTGPGRSEIVWR